MNSELIRIGIIGFGRMGLTHYSIINSHDNVKITCVADASGLVLSLLKKYVPGVNTYSDYKKLLDKEELDGVLVCTPPQLHYDIVRSCADLGIHVFVEKPFTTEYRKARELSEIFTQKGLINQVGYVNRYNGIFSKARSFVEDHLIGDVIRFRSEMFSRTVVEAEKGTSWRSKRESGGGVVYEMASHAIDIINYIIGKPDKISGTLMNTIFSKEIEDAVSSCFLYRNGITGTLYVNWSDASYRKPTNKIEVFGTKGKILADQHSMKIYLSQPDVQYGFREGWNIVYITDVFKPVPFYVRGNEFTSQLYDFVESIGSQEERSLCSFNEASETLDVIEGIFSDYHSNRKISN